jgi:hypothetical protein
MNQETKIREIERQFISKEKPKAPPPHLCSMDLNDARLQQFLNLVGDLRIAQVPVI